MRWKAVYSHLKNTLRHKWYVLKFACKAGIPIQGLIHDLSKFSPTEFKESVRYFTDGTVSPIITCKQSGDTSYAWLHHRGHNPHHWEYWWDDFDEGGIARPIPYKYIVELICDYLAAGKIYMKDKFSIDAEYEYWKRKREKIHKLVHPASLKLIDLIFEELKCAGSINWIKNLKPVINKHSTRVNYKLVYNTWVYESTRGS